jgi:hypothetical protein
MIGKYGQHKVIDLVANHEGGLGSARLHKSYSGLQEQRHSHQWWVKKWQCQHIC